MTTNFQIGGIDWDDKFIRRDIFTEGGLWVWGENGGGALATNNLIDRSSPVQTISGGPQWKQVVGNHVGQESGNAIHYAAGIKTDGTLWMWGTNDLGQLGDDTRTNRSSPVQTVAGGNNWKHVDLGGVTSSAIKTDGSLWMWGSNARGGLGDGTTTPKSSPVQTIAGGNNWKTSSVGYRFAAGIKTDGTLWMWGGNESGNLGDNTNIHRSSPVQTVAGGTNWKQVSCGGFHAGAVKTDGTLWMWGVNNYRDPNENLPFAPGILGDNSIIHRSSPVQTIAGGTNWKQVACCFTHTGAIKTDGTLWMWGANVGGHLGDNTRTHKSSPVQTISGGTNWKQVAVGGGFADGIFNGYSAGVKADGTLWLWGGAIDSAESGGTTNELNTGMLGDNTRVNKSSPVQTVAGGNNWKQVSLANGSTYAIREDFY